MKTTEQQEDSGERPAIARSSTEAYLRTDFLHALAHALRSPLTVVQGAIGELGGADTPSPLRDMARRNLGRIVHLAEQLDWVAELEGGHVELDREQADLATLANEALAGVDLSKLEVSRELPAGEAMVFADRRLVIRAISCLLENARRFSRSKLRVALETGDGRARLIVADDGPGIATERLETIYDRFSSARARGADSDLALGLSLARDYARLHGGELALSRSDDGGLRCELSLPLASA